MGNTYRAGTAAAVLAVSALVLAPQYAAAQTDEPTLSGLQEQITELQDTVADLRDTVADLQEQVAAADDDAADGESEADDESAADESEASEDTAAAAIRDTLFKGKSGEQVERLQRLLKSDEDIYNGPVTGYFGPQTERALRQFQEQNGLPETGILDDSAKDRINEILMEGAGQSGIIPPGLLKQYGDKETLEESDAQLPPGLQRGNGRGPFGGGDDEEEEDEDGEEDDDEGEEGDDDDEEDENEDTSTSTDET